MYVLTFVTSTFSLHDIWPFTQSMDVTFLDLDDLLLKFQHTCYIYRTYQRLVEVSTNYARLQILRLRLL